MPYTLPLLHELGLRVGAGAAQQRLTALHEEKKHQSRAQHGDKQPPVGLQDFKLCHKANQLLDFSMSERELRTMKRTMMLTSAMSSRVKMTANIQKVV